MFVADAPVDPILGHILGNILYLVPMRLLLIFLFLVKRRVVHRCLDSLHPRLGLAQLRVSLLFVLLVRGLDSFQQMMIICQEVLVLDVARVYLPRVLSSKT